MVEKNAVPGAAGIDPMDDPIRRALLERWRSGSGTTEHVSRISARHDRSARAPLSLNQERLWTFVRRGPLSVAGTESFCFRLNGALDVGLFKASIEQLGERHDILRTAIGEKDGEAGQSVVAGIRLEAEYIVLGQKDGERRALKIAHDLRNQPFEPFHPPLTRVALIRYDDDKYIAVIGSSHLVGDGWSLGVAMRDVMEAYAAGGRDVRPPLPIQYSDFAIWQRQWAASPEGRAQAAYWREVVSGSPPVRIPAENPGADGASDVVVRLGRARRARLAATARRERVSVFMLLLAAFSTLLSELCDADAVPIGCPMANRRLPETRDLIGCFDNLAIVVARMPDDATFRSLAHQIRATCAEAFSNEEYPLWSVREDLVREQGLELADVGPASPFLFVLQPPMSSLEFLGLPITPVELDRPSSRYDLTMRLWDSGDDIWGRLEHSLAVLGDRSAARTADRFLTLIDRAISDPGRRIKATVKERL